MSSACWIALAMVSWLAIGGVPWLSFRQLLLKVMLSSYLLQQWDGSLILDPIDSKLDQLQLRMRIQSKSFQQTRWHKYNVTHNTGTRIPAPQIFLSYNNVILFINTYRNHRSLY